MECGILDTESLDVTRRERHQVAHSADYGRTAVLTATNANLLPYLGHRFL
jgi:hypothetical protein